MLHGQTLRPVPLQSPSLQLSPSPCYTPSVPDIAAFHGLCLDPSLDPAQVTSPPYDVISPSERAELEAASPYNVVRLDSPSATRNASGDLSGEMGSEKYSSARALLDAWIAQGLLVRDDEPALYLYEETFTVDGASGRQIGILGAVLIGDDILPHERTIGPVVADRLDVIRAMEANLSPIFCLYWTARDDAANAIAATTATKPFMEFSTADGIGHRAWRMTDPALIAAVSETLAGARVVIADGHHRYRTAESYRDDQRSTRGDGPWDRVMLYLVDAERDAGALLPIHRLVSGLSLQDALDSLAEHFAIEPGPADADGLAAVLAAPPAGGASGRRFGFLGRDQGFVLTLNKESDAREATAGEHSDAWRDLDVAVLHTLVFDRLLGQPDVTYVHHPSEAAEAIGDGSASFAVLLAPTPVGAVRAIAEARDSMPPKSTFFIPKPRTGIVIRPLQS